MYNSMFLTKGIEGVGLIFSTPIRSKSLFSYLVGSLFHFYT